MHVYMRLSLVLACLVAGTGSAAAWDSPAPDVVLYCTPALETPLRQIAARFRAANHVEVHIFVGSPDGQVGLIAHRARADVVVADTPTIEVLKARHFIRPETVVTLGDNPFVLVGGVDAAFSPGQTALQLASAHAVVLTDATSAATFDGAHVLQAALPGLAAPKVIGVADTPTVIALVRGDKTLLGLVNRTEATDAGVKQVVPLSPPPVSNSAALVVNGQSGNAASLLGFIGGAEGRAILKSAGLEMTP
jgi:ABC-type molybdate transport system substrate-binding protein